MKKIVIITSSLREESNSSILAEAFKEGAEEVDNEVELISLKKNRIAPCLGCNYCQIHGECVMKDKLNEILDKVIDSDVLVLASPTYYYSVSSLLKSFIDRTYAKLSKIKDKDFYYIGSSADKTKASIDGALNTINGFLRCLDNVKLKGVVYGTNLLDVDDAKYSDSLKEAYNMGKAIK